MKNLLKELRRKDHPRVLGALDIFKFIGPGLLVTVGFIDPGNWRVTLLQVQSMAMHCYG